jgi:hypothetical protein
MTRRAIVPELDEVQGVRVVANPDALDRARWNPEDVTLVWRFAPDEAFGWRAGSPARSVRVDDPAAIVELEHGFTGAYLPPDDVDVIRRHCEFSWPEARPAIVQGKVAGVPVKLWLADFPNGDCLLVQTCYADELKERLGW